MAEGGIRPRGPGARVRSLPPVLRAAAVAVLAVAPVGPAAAQEGMPDRPPPDDEPPVAVPAAGDTVEFRHSDHEGLDCQACHETGMATVSTNLAFCRDCHHRGPRSDLCGRCHRPGEVEEGTYEVRRTLDLSVGDPAERTLSFPHGRHTDLPCGDCHVETPSLSAGGTDCAECHEEHHRAEADCAACHRTPPDTAHPPEVHVTCTGSGCHASAPEVTHSRERGACLVCHRDQEDHRPGLRCAECHVLPAAEATGGETG